MTKMADEERTMLGRKLSEMNGRTKSLQNKMLDINNRLRLNDQDLDQVEGEGAGDDDKMATFSRVSLVHANLRDHTDWVLRKKRELSSLSLGEWFFLQLYIILYIYITKINNSTK